MDSSQLARSSYSRLPLAIVGLGILFFLPAGTLNYWQAWLYLVVIIVPTFFLVRYLIQHDPALFQRRLRTMEKERDQGLIVKLFYLYLLVTFLLPGFDKRFGWSDAPVWMVLAANALVLLGYGFVIWVFKTNSYASRVVEVEHGQPVIDSGPYAIVRHPMYLGMALLFVMTPLALGSYWSMILSVMIVPLLAARILNEEKVLVRDLPGYTNYQRKVKKRLVPYLW